MPAWLAPAISAVGGIAANWINRQAEKKTNIDFFNMQNKYNTPKAQMNRLAEAGLNPALIYGSGSSGASGNAGTVSPVRSPLVDPAAGTNFMNDLYRFSLLEGQLDLQQQDINLKKAQTYATVSQGAGNFFDLGVKREQRSFLVDAAEANLEKTLTETQYTLDKNQREWLLTGNTLRQGMSNVLLNMAKTAESKQTVKNLKAAESLLWKDGQLRQLDIEWRKNGFGPNDTLYTRIAGRILSNYVNLDTGEVNWKKFDKEVAKPSLQFKSGMLKGAKSTMSKIVPWWAKGLFQ
jgi:hypothetical protein